MTSSSPLKTAA